jgi:hypothetical protein
MPREPSTTRVGVWRKLRALGVAQVLDGLVALPATPESRERLEWIAGEVLEADGEATIWLGRLGSARRERELVASMNAAVAEEYEAVRLAAIAAADAGEVAQRRTLARLRRELRRIGTRDHFGARGRSAAQRAVESLASSLVDA